MDRLGVGGNASLIGNHINDLSNPHATTASQVGAEIAGSASAVQWNLDLHEANLSNPHSTTASQINAVQANTSISGGTHTKIEYDAKGLVTSGSDATTADISDSLNRRYVTDAEKTVIQNTSGSNTGDQVVPVQTNESSGLFLTGYNALSGSFTTGSASGTSSSATYTGSSPIVVAGTIISHDVSGVVSGSYSSVQVDSRGHVISGSNTQIDHLNLSNIGTNSHSQIDADLLRLVNTTGSNTGDIAVVDTPSFNFSLSGQQVTGSVIPGGVDHNSLSNLAVGDPHPQYVEKAWDTMSGSLGVPAIQFDTTYAGASAEGLLHWNSNDGTLEYGLPGGNVNLQIGQEELIKVTNKSGGPLGNGQVVYVDGAQGNRPTVNLASGSSALTSDRVIGVLTEDIANNNSGYVNIGGLVRDVNTSSFSSGCILYLSASVSGSLTTTRPVAPNHATIVGYCITSASLGVMLVHVITGDEISDLHDVSISSPINNQVLKYSSSGSVWQNATLDHNTDLTNLTVGDPHTQYLTTASFAARDSLMKDPTGFTDPENITVTYNVSASTITLTGNVEAYWQGTRIPSLVSGWTSASHSSVLGSYYLRYDSGSFVFDANPWTFDKLQIAYTFSGSVNKFGVKETHGLLQWETHELFHETIGTFREAGGDLSGYNLASTTPTDRRPNVSATTLHDEDNIIVNPQLTSGSYTKFYLSGSSARHVFIVETPEIVPLSGNQPYYNLYTSGSWTQALMGTNTYMCVWLAAIPVSSDAQSQKYRYIWMQGQSSGTLASQEALSPLNLNLGDLSSITPEIVFLSRIILQYIGANWNIYSVTSLTGNKFTQVGSPAGTFLSGVTTDTTLTGDGTALNPLGVVGLFASASTPLRVSASASISGNNTGDQVVPSNVVSTSGCFFTAYNASTGSFTSASISSSSSQVVPSTVVQTTGCVLVAYNASTGSFTSASVASGTTGSSVTPQTVEFTSGCFLAAYNATTGSFTSASASASSSTPAAPQQTLFAFEGNLTTTTGSLRFYNFVQNRTISQVYLSAGLAPVTGSIVVDIHKNGTTIFTDQTNRPFISSASFTGCAVAIDVPSWAVGEYITAEIDRVGSATTGANLVVYVVYS